MAPELHTDRAGLAAPVSGTLYEGRAARTHTDTDPLSYPTGPEYRDLSELRAIAAQLAGKPLTLDHPDGLLRDGAQGVVIGQVVSARVEDDHVVASFLVHDKRGLDAIAEGTHELSLGYGCSLDEARFQRGISIDHLAVVPRARCGPSCSLRADSCGCDSEKAPEPEVKAEDDRHDTCTCKIRAVESMDMPDADKKLDEATAALEAARQELEAAKAELSATKAQLDAASVEIATLKTVDVQSDAIAIAMRKLEQAEIAATNAKADADKAEGALAGEKARADAAEAALVAAQTQSRQDADDTFHARVDARVELLASAKAVGVEVARTMSDRDIKVAVIKHVDAIEVAPEKSNDFVDGVFTGALDRHAKSAGSRTETRAALQQLRNDGAALPTSSADAERQARLDSLNKTSTAWMTPSDKRN